MANKEQLQDLAKVVNILIEGGYEFSGIEYKYISCSSHVLAHQFRGVKIKYDRNQMEHLSKGKLQKMDIFAYYNNKCFQLIK